MLKTDENGRVTFRRFPPDDYSMTAIVKGRGKGRLKRAIRAGGNSIAIGLEAE